MKNISVIVGLILFVQGWIVLSEAIQSPPPTKSFLALHDIIQESASILISHTNTNYKQQFGIHRFGALQSSSSLSADCDAALEAYRVTCPSILSLTNPDLIYSGQVLKGVCPCLEPITLPAVTRILKTCTIDVYISVVILKTLLCTQNVKKDKYCGEDMVPLVNQFPLTYTALTTALSRGDMTVLPAFQVYLGSFCTECMNSIQRNAFVLVGQMQQLVDRSSICDAACRSSVHRVANSLAMATTVAGMCVVNDNATEVVNGVPYCFPVFMGYLNAGNDAGCPLKRNATSCTGQCVWYNNTCYALSDDAVKSVNLIPPASQTWNTGCTNRCVVGLLGFTVDAVQAGIVKFPGEASSTTSPTNSENPAESLSLTCATNDNGNCLRQLITQYPVVYSSCMSDSNFTTSGMCGGKCSSAFVTVTSGLGCCYNTVTAISGGTNMLFGSLSVCAPRPTSGMCPSYNAYATSVPISGTCAWLSLNPTVNIEILRNGTARYLGVSTRMIQNFTVMDRQSGTPCRMGSSSLLSVTFTLLGTSKNSITQLVTFITTQGVWVPIADMESARLDTTLLNVKTQPISSALSGVVVSLGFVIILMVFMVFGL